MRSPVGMVCLERVAAVQPGIVPRVLAPQAATEVPPFKRRARLSPERILSLSAEERVHVAPT